MNKTPDKKAAQPVPPPQPPVRPSMYAPLRPLPRPPRDQESWPFLTGAWAGY